LTGDGFKIVRQGIKNWATNDPDFPIIFYHGFNDTQIMMRTADKTFRKVYVCRKGFIPYLERNLR